MSELRPSPHPIEAYLAEQAAIPGSTMTITKAAYVFLLEQLRSMEARGAEREAALPEPSLDALLLAAEEVDNSWYDDEGTVRWHPELWDRLVTLRRAHNAFEESELARLGTGETE